MSMKIESPDVKHLVNDYDIVFASGQMMPITIDLDLGDTIEYTDKTILIHLVAKPSQGDPDLVLPAEDVTIFLPHVISIQRREREVIQLNTDQAREWSKALQEMVSGTTH